MIEPGIPKSIRRLADCPLAPFGNLTMAGLGALTDPKHPAAQIVDTKCSVCGKPLQAMRFFAAITACDECCDKVKLEWKLEQHRDYWHSICPPGFRDTKTTHPQFAKAQYDQLKDYVGTENLLFYGPTRTGKTRLALHLLKRLLLTQGLYVGVVWPEQLKEAKHIMNRLQRIEELGRVKILLLDDALLTGAQDERLSDFLKDLIDYRLRQQHATIITSQIGSEDYIEQAGKFDQPTKADLQRIKALLARIKESYRILSFASAKPTSEEIGF